MHIYERLGIPRVINGYECLTRLGGSIMEPEVLAAMCEASEHFVRIDDLQKAVGDRIACLVGVEAAFVSSGAAAGLSIATAACITGIDKERARQLPNTDGMRSEVLIEREQRNPYDRALRQAGVELVEYGNRRGTSPEELDSAISDTTAAIAYFVTSADASSLPLNVVADIAHRRGVPVIVDAAAEIPPATNLRRFVEQGGDLVVFSGGKGLRGPQSSGLVLGRRYLIEACVLNASPNHGIGRPMKVGKEEMIGVLVALERYLDDPPDQRLARWEAQVQKATVMLGGLPGLLPSRTFPMPTGKLIPRVLVEVTNECVMKAEDIITALRQGDPIIEVRPDPLGFVIDPQGLQKGEMKVICHRIANLVADHEYEDAL